MNKSTFQRIIAGLAVLITVISMAGCASSGGSSGSSSKNGRKVSKKVPDFVKKAVLNAAEDAILGVGTANMSTDSMSLDIATTRARAEVARTMNSIIKNMIRDFTEANEVDHESTVSFQENITVALTHAKLEGVKRIEFDYDEKGAMWVIVSMGSADAVKAINQATAKAKNAVGKMESLEAEGRMEAAFEKERQKEVGYADSDKPIE